MSDKQHLLLPVQRPKREAMLCVQLTEHLKHVQVDSEIVPLIRASYTEEITAKLGQSCPDERGHRGHFGEPRVKRKRRPYGRLFE